MATVIIGTLEPHYGRPVHPKAYLQTSRGARFTLPFAPRETDHSGDADEWSTIPRTGRKPLVRRNGAGLRTLAFSFLMGSTNPDASIESQISVLRTVTGNADMVLFSLGYLERGWWRVTDVSVSPLLRQEFTNAVTRATVSIQMIEAYDVRPKIGRTATRPSPKPPSKSKPSARPPQTRTVTVKKGDTLFELAVKYLGSGPRWKEIAKLNKISDPRKLKVGQKLRIPPR